MNYASALANLKPPFAFGDPKQIEMVQFVELVETVVAEAAQFTGNPLPIQCPLCNGKGIQDCDECNGVGDCSHCGHHCDECDGTGELACELCEGAKEISAVNIKGVQSVAGLTRDELAAVLVNIRAARGITQ